MQLDQLGLTFCFNNFFVSHIDMIILSTKKKKKRKVPKTKVSKACTVGG